MRLFKQALNNLSVKVMSGDPNYVADGGVKNYGRKYGRISR